MHVRVNGNLRGDAQEIFAVPAGVVCDAANDALFVEEIVAERRNRAHVNAAEDQRSTFAKNVEGGWNNRSGRGKDDGGVELVWRFSKSVPSPLRAEIEGQALMANVACHGVNLDVPVERDLYGDVSCGAEPVEAEFVDRLWSIAGNDRAAGVWLRFVESGEAQGSKADDSRA